MKVKSLILLASILLSTSAMMAQELNGREFVLKNNKYKFPDENKGRVLDADSKNLGKNGTTLYVIQNNNIHGDAVKHQKWQFVFANKGADVYYIKKTDSRAGNVVYLDASYIDLGKSPAVVQLWSDNRNAKGQGEPNQLWKVTKNADSSSYRIASAHPRAKGVCLDGSNTGVMLILPNNEDAQAWTLLEK
ncbi:MAG: RICIN domain-containing protein [Chitinophagales bacterium]|nr:RICIN domain-containing protein [Chitinophagales bacterium]